MRILTLFLVMPFMGFAQMDSTVYENVDVEAKFPGEDSEMMAFIMDNLVYPEIAIEQGAQGFFQFSFIVEKNGELTESRCLNCQSPELNQMIADLVNKMPDWVPATLDGKKVRMRYTMPLFVNLK
jgi:Gram-negative bacterial TonB protein C-terminal